jgi:hypothetical protein
VSKYVAGAHDSAFPDGDAAVIRSYDTALESRLSEMDLDPAIFGSLQLLDKSTDPEDVREELKTELLVLNVALKNLNKDWDFSAVILPLIAEQGPPLANVQRLSKQIERLKKSRDDFQRIQPNNLAASPAAPSGPYVGSAELYLRAGTACIPWRRNTWRFTWTSCEGRAIWAKRVPH